MSLDNIQLSSKVIEELYGNSLISLENNQSNTPEKTPKFSAYLGDNLRHILILVNEKNQKYLPEEDLELLTNILKACELTLADVAIVNVDQNQTASYEHLNENFTPAIVLFFGTEPQQLGYPLQFPQYKLQQYNHQTYIASASLHILKTDVAQKKLFWNCLRVLFNK